MWLHFPPPLALQQQALAQELKTTKSPGLQGSGRRWHSRRWSIVWGFCPQSHLHIWKKPVSTGPKTTRPQIKMIVRHCWKECEHLWYTALYTTMMNPAVISNICDRLWASRIRLFGHRRSYTNFLCYHHPDLDHHTWPQGMYKKGIICLITLSDCVWLQRSQSSSPAHHKHNHWYLTITATARQMSSVCTVGIRRAR